MVRLLKKQEEDIKKARRKTANEKAVIIERAISAGMGNAESLPGIIYERSRLFSSSRTDFRNCRGSISNRIKTTGKIHFEALTEAPYFQ